MERPRDQVMGGAEEKGKKGERERKVERKGKRRGDNGRVGVL